MRILGTYNEELPNGNAIYAANILFTICDGTWPESLVVLIMLGVMLGSFPTFEQPQAVRSRE